MIKYTVVNQSVKLTSGIIRLSDDQAKVRLHNLNFRDDNCYEIVNPIYFKNGEVFEYGGDLDKSEVNFVEILSKKASKKSEAVEDKKAG